MSGPAVHLTAGKETWRRPCSVCGHDRSWIDHPDMCVVCYELTIDPDVAGRLGRIVERFVLSDNAQDGER